MTVESLLIRFLQMLFDLSSLVPSIPQVDGVSDSTFDPVQMISHLFQEMASGSDGCRQALCKVCTWTQYFIVLGRKHVGSNAMDLTYILDVVIFHLGQPYSTDAIIFETRLYEGRH